MRRAVRFCLLLGVVLVTGCSKDIGDACIVSSDCDPNGLRECDIASPGGYCTIQGCDYNTCPEDSACIRFFTGSFDNRPCDPATEDQPGGMDQCSEDELCALAGHCVPRSSEVRFCMKTCSSNDDCRSSYECRDLETMKEHGGEPVLAPGDEVDDHSPRFCAAAPGTL
jgi:hypothetical protein